MVWALTAKALEMNFLQMALLFVIAAPFGLAVWVAFQHRKPSGSDGRAVSDEEIQVGATRPSFKANVLHLEAEVRAVADTLAEEARVQYVRVQLAVFPGSKVHMDWNALWRSLRATMRTAIQAAPGGNVLVTGKQVGNEMHIVVMDDGTFTDQLSRGSLAREAQTLIALQGGSVIVEARRGHGTTVTIRLPLPREVGVESRDMMTQPTLAHEAV
jgi:hypothetical protein